MTLFEWISAINAATTLVLIFVWARGRAVDRTDMARKLVHMADTYPRGIEKLTASMGWTTDQMNTYLKEARERLEKEKKK